MYECDCHIGCLTGAVTRVGGIEQELSGAVTRFGKGLSGYVSMVCSVSKDAYLEVSTDVLWLTPDMLGEEFDIYSNVNWKID